MKKTFAINKFVREGSLQEMAKSGGVVAKDIVGKDLLYALQCKVYEGVGEALNSTMFDEQTSDLADALDALRAIAQTMGIDWSSIEGRCVQKNKQNGSYVKGTYIETLTLDEETELAKKLLGKLEQHHEI